MSTDKRTVTIDALETLGTIITDAEKRDAIHLAVEPVIAGQTLAPGQDIGMIGDRAYIVKPEHRVGIVDPFLKEPVLINQRFWLVIYPRQIHSLRHVWTHPAFPDAPEVAGMAPKVHSDPKADSEAWLRKYCEDCGYFTYENVIKTARGEPCNEPYGKAYSLYGDVLIICGEEVHGEHLPAGFWDHLERAAGVNIGEGYRPTELSCTC